MAENKINGKKYIGQTIHALHTRKNGHKQFAKRGVDTLFHRSLRKNGFGCFRWNILCKCDSKEELDDMEFHYIRQYNSIYPNGYNMTMGCDGGDTLSNHPDLEKISKKISIATKGNRHYSKRMEDYEEWKNNNMRGKNHSHRRYKTDKEYKEWIEKNKTGENSPTRKGKTDEKYNEWLDKYFKGDGHYTKRCMNEDQYNEWIEKQRNKIMSEETRRKMSESHKGKSMPKGSKSKLAKKYVITKPDGGEFVIIGIKEFCRNYKETKMIRQGLYNCIKGNVKTYKGYKCREFNANTDVNIPVFEINGGDYH